MAKTNWQCPNEWSQWSEWLAAGLHARNRWRLPVLLTGILFAVGLRTVTSRLRASGVNDDFQDYDYFLAPLGRKANSVATQLFLLVLCTMPLPDRLSVVIDDSPTKRYGPEVDRAAIEQHFHDVKEVWGAGRQQVRNLWSNVAFYPLNLRMHTLAELSILSISGCIRWAELWAWNRPHAELCDRSDSPWDDPERRPSHADRRNSLRRHIMRNELSAATAIGPLPRKIISLAQRLMALVA
jgi:hypothetical protein